MIIFHTLGKLKHKEVLATLKEKFGQPTRSQQLPSYSDRMDSSLRMAWNMKDVVVDYGIVDVDVGSVRVDTAKYRKEASESEAQNQKDKAKKAAQARASEVKM